MRVLIEHNIRYSQRFSLKVLYVVIDELPKFSDATREAGLDQICLKLGLDGAGAATRLRNLLQQ